MEESQSPPDSGTKEEGKAATPPPVVMRPGTRLRNSLYAAWYWLSTTKREHSGLEGWSEDTEYNAPQAIATISMFVSAIATVTLAIGTFIMTCETRRTSLAAIEANKMARKNAEQAWSLLELQRRPWLIGRLDFESYNPEEHRVVFSFVLKNCGIAPAVGVNIMFRSESGPRPSAYAGKAFSQIPWAKGDIYLSSGDSVVQQAESLKYWPDIMTTSDTNYIHACCFFSNAESRTKYYYETVYGMSNLQPGRRAGRPGYYCSMSLIAKPYFGRVVNDTVVLDTF